MDKNLSDLLDRCADDVSRDGGWIQGEMGDPSLADSPVCAVGAVERHFGIGYTVTKCDAYSAIKNQIGFVDIPLWNDIPGRTAGEVADMFRSVAKGLRGS